MLKNNQLDFLKKELLEMKSKITEQKEKNSAASLQGENLQEDSIGGELSMYDNHPADLGTALFDRTKDFALEEHSETQLSKIDTALRAIEQSTYGKCAVCNKDISFERLQAVPTTLYCKEHSDEVNVPQDRPVEEEVLGTSYNNEFSHNKNDGVIDYEDSFQEVARYGTSETPSDLIGDYDSYSSLYDEDQAHIVETYIKEDTISEENKTDDNVDLLQ